MARYRLGQLTKDDEVNQQFLSDDEQRNDNFANEQPIDEFEDLINQQIALSTSALPSTTFGNHNVSAISGISQVPKSSQTSSSQIKQKMQLTDEQKALIEENKRRAMAKREARLLREQEDEKQSKLEEEQKQTYEKFSDLLFDDDCLI